MNKKKIWIYTSCFSLITILSYIFLMKTPCSEVKVIKYDKDKHYNFAKQVMLDNFFWVVQGWTKENYPFDERLIQQIPYSQDNLPKPPHLDIAVATYNNQMAGVITYYVEPDRTTGVIQILSVDRNFKRKGIGKALINHAIEELKKENVDQIYLVVRYDNIPAYNLYVDLGFKKIEVDEENESSAFKTIYLLLKIKE